MIPVELVDRIEQLRRTRRWSGRRIALELAAEGTVVSVRTVGRHLAQRGLNRRRFLDPNGEPNRVPRRIIARRPGHMVHVDIKKVGRIPDGGGWRVHGRGSRSAWRTRNEAENALFAYMDGWYNSQRIQKKLGWRSPDEFEASYHHPVPTGT